MKERLYFDNCATTRVTGRISEIVTHYNCAEYSNPSAMYDLSIDIERKINHARAEIADKILKGGEVIFTSGGTEANNLAIFGGFQKGSGNIVTTKVEHPSVYNAILEMKARGVEVRYAPLNPDASVNINKFEEMIDMNTGLVAIMHVNNEVGSINDLAKLAEITKKKSRALFFSDGVQGFLKIPLTNQKIDMYSFSGHKTHAPKGIGGLWVRNGVKLNKLFFGGGQEKGIRSGTENVSGIMALYEAAKIFKPDPFINEFKNVILGALSNECIDYRLACETNCSPFILSVLFKDIKGEVLMRMLEADNVFVGIGSACSSKKKGNRILQAVGIPQDYIEGLIRISFSQETTLEEVRLFSQYLPKAITKLKKAANLN